MPHIGDTPITVRASTVGLVVALALATRSIAATPCSFVGTTAEQAKCLLRPVAKLGVVGDPLAALPAPLDRLVGTVTVRVDGVEHRATRQPTPVEIARALTGPVVASFKYARIQGTTREQYRANGGAVDVGASEPAASRKLAWLTVSRESYVAAWGRDRNELLVAWARGGP